MTAPTRRPSALIAAVALTLLLGLQPVTTDLYLPALPAIKTELRASMHATQLTMAALLLAFGLGQLVAGPVADRFGRRPVLLSTLSVYVLASLGAMLANTIEALVMVRVVQGAVMAGVIVVARAMVRDLYEPHEGVRIMSLGLSGLGLIAITSPLLGGWLAGHGGWQTTFAAAGVIGCVTLVFVATQLPETLRQKNPRALHPGPLLTAWATVLRHPTFLAWAGLSAATYGGLFMFLAGSSFAYMEVLGLDAAQYGLALATSSISYLGGTFVCRRWLVRHGMAGAVRRAAVFTLAGGLSMAALAAAGVQTVWAILVPQLFYAFGHGTHQACGQTGAVGPFPQQAGVAAALAGFVLALVAFCIGQWLGLALDGTTRPLAYGIATGSVVTTLIAWTTVQRHGGAA